MDARPDITPEDLESLRQAVRLLEVQSLAMRIANFAGMPIEAMMKRLPAAATDVVQRAAHNAIERCFEVAARSLDFSAAPVSDPFHRFAAGVTGALGGAAGLLGLTAELPVTTTLMLRSIAAIAREHGEDLSQAEARLACITVFALGGPGRGDDATETGYYAVRIALSQTIAKAASEMAERGLSREAGSAVVRLLTRVASRFGITVSEKAAAQAVPIAGAVGGAAINLVFTSHFQDVARGHFTVRKLERKYGFEAVHEAYARIKERL